MGDVLDFEKSVLQLRGNRFISPIPTVGGRPSIRWIFIKLVPADSQDEEDFVPIFAAEEEQILELNRTELTKIHVQFGHAGVNTISRILRLDGENYFPPLLQRIVQSCQRNQSSGLGEMPAVCRYLCEYPGQVIAMDTFFPHPMTPQEYPALIIADSFSEFVCVRFLPNNRPEQYVEILVGHRAVLFGFPKRILADRPTSFGGPLWQSICHTFDVELISAPTRASNQIGLAERHVRTIKMSYNALWGC